MLRVYKYVYIYIVVCFFWMITHGRKVCIGRKHSTGFILGTRKTFGIIDSKLFFLQVWEITKISEIPSYDYDSRPEAMIVTWMLWRRKKRSRSLWDNMKIDVWRILGMDDLWWIMADDGLWMMMRMRANVFFSRPSSKVSKFLSPALATVW